MPHEIGITVIIVTHGRAEPLSQVLESLFADPLPPGFRELIVVENSAPCGAREIVARHGHRAPCRYLFVNNPNKSGSLNVALEQTRSGLVVFLDDDIEIRSGLLSAYARAARAHAGKKVFFGGSVLPGECPPFEASLAGILPLSIRGFDFGPAEVYLEPGTTFIGNNWAAHAEDLIRLGGFDTRFGPGAESGATGQERSMQLRLWEAGYIAVFIPGASVIHPPRPEQFTAGWAVARRFRNGIEEGIHASGSAWAAIALVADVHVRLLRRIAALVLRPRRSSVVRFRAAVARLLGAYKGIWYGIFHPRQSAKFTELREETPLHRVAKG